MDQMNAAVVTSSSEPPHYMRFDRPHPTDEKETSVEVLAAGLHPRVRSGASGSHYTSAGLLPMIPGVDGVGRLSDGRLIYFAADDRLQGTMAERAIASRGRWVELPADVDIAKVAGAMNPAMSSWVALRQRVALQTGQSVLVLGATGNAGAMAVTIAKRLGAAYVVAAGRNPTRLQALRTEGADATVELSADAEATQKAMAAVAAEVDVVIDYLWGEPSLRAMTAIVKGRSDRSRRLDWIQIGAITGPTIALPSAALRSANLRIQGSGQGSVSPRAYLAELPSLVAEINAGTIPVTVRTEPLAAVERVWNEPTAPGERVVLTP